MQRAYFKLENKLLDNNNDNCVNLIYSDHILAHYYLCMCTKNKLDEANRSAFFFMLNTSPEDFNEKEFIESIFFDYNILYEQMKKDMSERFSGQNNPMYGIERSQETKNKISKSSIGKHSKPVICLETLKVYDSCIAAAKDIGSTDGNICQCCKKEYYTIFGLHFRYYDKNIDYSKVEIPKQIKPYNTKRKKKVKCLELNTVYDSIREASEKTGANAASISKCCRGDYKKAGGYRWQYVE